MNVNMKKTKMNINELFSTMKQKENFLNISAPMVRYSKLEFRKLLRKYGVDLCFTPMIVAKSFYESAEARKVEFRTNLDDKPLIAQFAASNSFDLTTASELIYPFVDGIDINCGCPQKWAISSGYGCALLKEPEILHDMIRSIRRIIPNNEFSCSIKMRLLQKEIKYTIDLCRQFEACGITFLTVHGRTPWQKSSESVNIEALCDIKKSIKIPLIGNGDIRKLNDAKKMHEMTNCDGVMAARGLLSNPTLFQGTDKTPMYCIQDWINLAHTAHDDIPFSCLHHHLTFMMEKYLKRKQRVIFNNFNKKEKIFNFLHEQFNITAQCQEAKETLETNYSDDLLYKINQYVTRQNVWNERTSNGKYFDEFKESNSSDCDSLTFMDTTIFDL